MTSSKLPFLARTAIRDSRKDRRKLFMFMSSIILGIAALVAINSFNYNVINDVDREAATLLGADLVLERDQPLTESLAVYIDSLPGERASEMELFSMSYLPKTGESQFIRVKALQGDFPFYGKLKTMPETAGQTFRNKRAALVDESMMLQYGLQVGDSIKVGQATFPIEGRLLTTFGSIGAGSSFAPAVYFPQKYIGETELVQPGSFVEYYYYFHLPRDFDPDNWEEQHRQIFRDESTRIETIEEQKEDLTEAFANLNYFLNLVALVSLLLGCIGVASSVFIYIKNKISSIAIFRCLGMKGNQAFLIYFLQILALGIIGALIGTALGSGVQIMIPRILSDFLPLQVSTEISWPAIWEGLTIGLIITVLFALIPLIAVRKISPLRTLRASFDEDIQPADPLRWLIYGAITISLLLFLWRLTGSFQDGAVFTGGLIVAFLVLYGVSLLIIRGVRKYFPRHWNFVLRQGLSNLFRPNNQTQTLLVSIGLGTAILTTLFIIQGLLLNNVAQMDAGNQPNMILYGIERSQKEGLAEITEKFEMPVIQQVPIVTMTVLEWKGRSKKEWFADSTSRASRWAANRESRVTFRDSLDASETVIRGRFRGKVASPGDSVFISLSDNYADALKVDVGDEIVFNVQGTRIKTYVGSIRTIDFRRMQTNFMIVFPAGVLEEAPQFQVLITKSPNTATTASYRSEVVRTFPNVSVIDLGSILETLNNILNKISYIIKFMAAFSILTGLIVLISSLLLTKFQRIKESVLLRTMGASRRQILQINATEYALLGALSAATGIIISLVGSYLLARYQLELDFNVKWLPILGVFLLVVALTVSIGLLNSREVVRRSPLEVLRREVG